MLELHHIGNLVKDIDSAVETSKLLYGSGCASEKTLVSSQKVWVCFVDIGKNVFIELIQPVDDTSPVYSLLKKGISYYHMAYLTDDFDTTNDLLVSNNFKTLNLFHSEAFNNKRCQFMYSPQGNLIELIEK